MLNKICIKKRKPNLIFVNYFMSHGVFSHIIWDKINYLLWLEKLSSFGKTVPIRSLTIPSIVFVFPQDMYKEEIQRLKSKRMKEEQLTKTEREKIKQLEETLSKMVEDKVCNCYRCFVNHTYF